MPKMMERLIESLPRYSHNYYYSIVRMHNLDSLSKRRWKFMFGFSNKPTSKCLEEDYDKHTKQLKEITNKKNNVLENYNKLIKELSHLHFRGIAPCCNNANKKRDTNYFNLANNILNTDYIFSLSADEMLKDLNNLHMSIFHQSDFMLGSRESTNSTAGSVGESETTSNEIDREQSSRRSMELRNVDNLDENKFIKEAQPFGNPFKLIIRPKNQSIQLSEMEDESFITSVTEKKKANKLAGFANIYKNEMSKKIKDYAKYHRSSIESTGSEIEQKIQLLQKKHLADNCLYSKSKNIRKDIIGKVQDLQNISNSSISLLEKEDIYQNKQDGNTNISRNTVDNSVILVDEREFTGVVSKTLNTLKKEKFKGNYFEATIALFDDLMNIIQEANSIVDNHQLVIFWASNYDALSSKYKEVCGVDLIKKKVMEVTKDHFNVEIFV